MDQPIKNRSSAGRSESSATFSETDYANDPGKVMAHAAATGTAVVVNAEGRPRVIITIPTTDLPVLGD
jgi:hypothetical protein